MIQKLLGLAFMWFYAILYGTVALFNVVKTIFTKGFGKVFNKTKRERPACLQDEKWGTHGFLHLEDVRIHYVAKGPEDKPLMLFLHGFPEFWFSWRHQLSEFSNDYRCVAIDMRGYGESDKPSGISNYQIKYLIKDIQQVIEALGYKSCILVAHDWGGAVAWNFAKHFPDYVDKLIVMNCPAPPVFQKIIRTVKKQFKMSWYMFFFQLPFLPEFIISLEDYRVFDTFGESTNEMFEPAYVHPLSTEEIEAFKYTFSQPGALTPTINYYRAALRMPEAKTDMDYKMPVLLVWGMKDMALCDEMPTLTEKMAPKIVIRRIENSGHFVQSDAPVETNKIMREWLSSQG